MMEAKAAAKRKGAFVMMVEQDLMLARFLAGLYSHKVLAVPSFTTTLFNVNPSLTTALFNHNPLDYKPLRLQPSSTTTLFDYNPL